MFLFLLFVGLAKGEDVDFGWITPLHGTDGKCAEASQRYIEAFGVADDLQKNMTWGPYVLDADGRLPLEGFLSDSTPIPLPLCEIFGAALPNCEQLPSFLTNVVLYVPTTPAAWTSVLTTVLTFISGSRPSTAASRCRLQILTLREPTQ